MEQSCSECHRLRQEQTDAISALLRLVEQMQEVIIQHDHTALSRVKAALDEGTKRCEAARLAFEEHSLKHE